MKQLLKKSKYVGTYSIIIRLSKIDIYFTIKLFRETYNNFTTIKLHIIFSKIFDFIFYLKIITKIINKKVITNYFLDLKLKISISHLLY